MKISEQERQNLLSLLKSNDHTNSEVGYEISSELWPEIREQIDAIVAAKDDHSLSIGQWYMLVKDLGKLLFPKSKSPFNDFYRKFGYLFSKG